MREIKQWITINGVHVPIFEGQTKEEAVNDFINQKTGLSDEYIITSYPQPDNIAQIKEDYFKKLNNAGIFGTSEQLDNFLKSHPTWKEMEDRRRWQQMDDWGYREVTADEFKTLSFSDSFAVYMKYEEFKKLMFSKPESLNIPNTLSEGLKIYYGGMSKKGYGQYTKSTDARQIWDEKYKFSEFLDKHPELQLNTQKILYRGLRLSDKSIKELQKAYKTGNSIDFFGPSSWTLSEGVARDFGRHSLVGQRNKNICIFQEVGGGKHTAMPFIHGHDAEVIYSGNSEFDIIDISRNEEGWYYVKVKERK